MFCRYCGKPIVDDSVFCQHCGRNVSVDGFNNNLKSESFKDRIGLYYSKWKCNIKRSDISSSIKKIVVFLWKVIQSLFIIIGIIITYMTIGFIMAPFIAMFNAEIPSLGMSDMLVDIWTKKKNEDVPKKEN